MTPKIKRKLREYVSYFGFQVKYVPLPDKVSGFLQPGPNPRYIFLNERKPHCDHAFTIAHEIAHYVMHVDRTPRNRLPAYIDHPWKLTILRESTQMTKQWVLPLFEPEGEADAWAFAFLLKLGAVDDVLSILELYPKKFWIFFLICVVSGYSGVKLRTRNFFRELLNVFKSKLLGRKLSSE